MTINLEKIDAKKIMLIRYLISIIFLHLIVIGRSTFNNNLQQLAYSKNRVEKIIK